MRRCTRRATSGASRRCARYMRVRTVVSCTPREAAVSMPLMPSTTRSTNTVRKTSGRLPDRVLELAPLLRLIGGSARGRRCRRVPGAASARSERRRAAPAPG